MLLSFIKKLKFRLAFEEIVYSLILDVRQETRQILTAACARNAKDHLAIPELGLLDRLVKVSKHFAVGKDRAALDDIADLFELISDPDSNLRQIRVFTGDSQITDALNV